MCCGVYQISNSINGNLYIGSAVDFEKRKEKHIVELRTKKHHNIKLQRFVNKYGIDKLEFNLLAKCPIEYRFKLEQWFIDTQKPFYNIAKNARGGRNKKLTEEEFISIAYKYIEGTDSINAICSENNISVSTFWNYVYYYKGDILDKLNNVKFKTT